MKTGPFSDSQKTFNFDNASKNRKIKKLDDQEKPIFWKKEIGDERNFLFTRVAHECFLQVLTKRCNALQVFLSKTC